jgi:serine protease Do
MRNEYDYQDHSENNIPEQPQQQQPQQQPQAGYDSGSYHYTRQSMPGGDYQSGYQAGYGYQPQGGGQVPPTNGGQVPPQNPNPMAGYNVTPHQAPKQSGGSKRVIALAIVCALVGGLGGGAAVGMALRGNTTTAVEETAAEAEGSTLQEDQAEAQDDTEEATTAFNSTVIDVTTNSQTTEMTPQDVYEKYVNAVVAISNESTTTNIYGQVSSTASSGSGFIISEDGYIVTNNHVVSGAQKLTVIMTNGDEYEAQIIGADSENDVALIKIEATDLPTVSIGDSDSIQVGQQVCAIGNPLGELTNTLTVGYVSALDREINENGTPINMFQTDCAINSGNSGGPIFDMHGNVVGITTAKYSSSSSVFSSTASIEGIGFCIPSNDAMDIVSDLLQYGYVKGRPALGISCQAISSTVTQYYNLPTGIYVSEVEEGSAADNAGLQQGDIITELDGTSIDSVTDFKALLKQYAAGDTATLTVYRGQTGQTEEIEVTFDEKQTTTTTTTQESDGYGYGYGYEAP